MVGLIRLATRDALAERVLPVLLGALALLVMGLPLARGTAMGAGERAATDFALWLSWIVGCGVAMWLGARCIAQPLEDRSALWILTGPVSAARWGLSRVAGAGLVAVLMHTLFTTLCLVAVGWPPGAVAFLLTTTGEVVLLTALAAFLGTVYSPLPALTAVVALWLIGHVAGLWEQILAEQGYAGPAAMLLAAIPDLDLLDTHGAVVSGKIPSLQQVGLALLWATAWTTAALAGTVAVLNRRDL